MPIWNPASIEVVPEIRMARWSIYEVVCLDGSPERTRHFVGYNLTEREGRVSSSIVEFDPNTKCGRTSSGRVYQLAGSPGYDSDAEYTFARWRNIHNVLEYENVSSVVFEQQP